jgi:hypothetical protein
LLSVNFSAAVAWLARPLLNENIANLGIIRHSTGCVTQQHTLYLSLKMERHLI